MDNGQKIDMIFKMTMAQNGKMDKLSDKVGDVSQEMVMLKTQIAMLPCKDHAKELRKARDLRKQAALIAAAVPIIVTIVLKVVA